MTDYFKTDTEELGRFRKTLENAKAELDNVRKLMQDVSAEGIGTKELDAACAEFHEHWKYGSEQIAEMTGKFAEGVNQSRANYEEVDKALEEGFAKAAAQGGGK
ncbi:type VII secretion target [Streptomyces poonensis]|uniref:Uncharacterized protein n=1 Tax=Streptomyces poonensis TaxID=68255 RepID=A0A918QAE3_9ACTN|nr:type VII secretion target [Streptomyces poonensis]GGZ39134.1 hypothetical protein GCM10010365_69840 [Streptomyces poonensis]GLJ93124.1 hypothetical protein GCM10017589_57360 [Streptomyces poonensis]